MPIHRYQCGSCSGVLEELFLGSEKILDELDCDCGGVAKRSQINRFRHVGPVFEDLEAYTGAFYSQKQQANGARVRSYKDVKRFENENNLARISPDSQAWKHQVENAKQEEYEMSCVKQESGRAGVADYIYKKEMQDVTGWSDMKYSRWKTTHDAAQKSAKSGKIDVSQSATAGK
tara:strand:+ start:561 stop:1085 length:525 start_codon:yes stop_codon:yes gene_type:complete